MWRGRLGVVVAGWWGRGPWTHNPNPISDRSAPHCPPPPLLLRVSQQTRRKRERGPAAAAETFSPYVCSHLSPPYIKQTLSKRTSRNWRGTPSCLAVLPRLTRGRGGGGEGGGGGGEIYLLEAGWGGRLNVLLAHMCGGEHAGLEKQSAGRLGNWRHAGESPGALFQFQRYQKETTKKIKN